MAPCSVSVLYRLHYTFGVGTGLRSGVRMMKNYGERTGPQDQFFTGHWGVLKAAAHLPIERGQAVKTVGQTGKDNVRLVAEADFLHDAL